jgi:hypothetical protein
MPSTVSASSSFVPAPRRLCSAGGMKASTAIARPTDLARDEHHDPVLDGELLREADGLGDLVEAVLSVAVIDAVDVIDDHELGAEVDRPFGPAP